MLVINDKNSVDIMIKHFLPFYNKRDVKIHACIFCCCSAEEIRCVFDDI